MKLFEFDNNIYDSLKEKYAHLPLKDQVTLVTGGSSGVGQAIAFHTAAAGAKLIINCSKHTQSAENAVEVIKKGGGEALYYKADVSCEQDVLGMFEFTLKHYGTIHNLINNAGIQKDAVFHEMSLQDWDHVIGVNLTGQFLCAREAVKEFLRREFQPSISSALGKIIFISSVHEIIPWAGHANYAASKSGSIQLMKTIAQEYGPKKIRCNSIAPGAIQTPINRPAWETEESIEELMKYIPYNRIGSVNDIANAAVWLSSDDADYVTGTTLLIDGGMSLYKHFSQGG